MCVGGGVEGGDRQTEKNREKEREETRYKERVRYIHSMRHTSRLECIVFIDSCR